MDEAAIREEVSDMLGWTEDRLHQAFAQRNRLLGRQALPPNIESLRNASREWLRDQSDRVREAVCRSTKVKAAFGTRTEGDLRLHLVLAVSEAIGHLVVHQPGVSPLAVLLVRMGVEDLCRECWKQA